MNVPIASSKKSEYNKKSYYRFIKKGFEMVGKKPEKYDIKHRKVRLQSMIYEDQLAWIKRNHNKKEHKSESEFITNLISLGIIAYRNQKLAEIE